MICRQLLADGNQISLTEMCRVVGVSRSGFYAWRNHEWKRQDKEQRDCEDFEIILQAYKYRGYDKGINGLYMRLKRMGKRMNRKKIRRLCRKYGLQCPIRKTNPYRQMAKALKTNAIADNMVKRQFREHGPRQVLLTDITYIPLDKEFCYLSVIMDAYTKQALSHVLSQSLEVDFVLETIEQLFNKYGPSIPEKAFIHSDQGCHYTSVAFRELVKNKELRQSMSRRGNCWDNAPQESFFGHMKEELREKMKMWKTYEDVKRDIDDWMDYYNNDRYQIGLNELAPNEFYISITRVRQKLNACP